MVLGRLAHYAFDAVLISTAVAGVRRSSGFTLNVAAIPEDNTRMVVEKVLGVGETVFDMLQATAVNSQYFKKDSSSR